MTKLSICLQSLAMCYSKKYLHDNIFDLCGIVLLKKLFDKGCNAENVQSKLNEKQHGKVLDPSVTFTHPKLGFFSADLWYLPKFT